jgi:hypothetical protein
MSAPRELKRPYEAFLAANDIGVDEIELVTDRAGTTYTHDVNPEQSRSRRSRLPFRQGNAGPSSRRRLPPPEFSPQLSRLNCSTC